MVELISHLPANRTMKTPLLLQHGAWHGAWCWENGLDHFAELGYEVHALRQPSHGRTPLAKEHINLYLMAEPRWREVADSIDQWLTHTVRLP
jgi:pimeloyl-ACP methyl ester carboxylesterase